MEFRRSAHGRAVTRLGTFAIIMAPALLSVLASGVTLFGGASTGEKLQENSDLLKDLAAGQKEIIAGQKEIISLLKAYAPTGASAAATRAAP